MLPTGRLPRRSRLVRRAIRPGDYQRQAITDYDDKEAIVMTSPAPARPDRPDREQPKPPDPEPIEDKPDAEPEEEDDAADEPNPTEDKPAQA